MSAPTIVLVHGAFSDAGIWKPVVSELIRHGYQVRVPSVSNRSLSEDAAYIKSFVEQIDGPVVLAGHSYGGAVITVAGDADNVVALVYVSGHALAEGESIRQLHDQFPDSPVSANIVRSSYPSDDGKPKLELSIRIDAFPSLFAGCADSGWATVLAVSQRPLAVTAVDEAASVAAWKTKPSWGIVAAFDRIVHPDVERFGYERAGMRRVVEVNAPHLVMRTHPEEVVELITEVISEVGLGAGCPPDGRGSEGTGVLQ